MKGQRDKSVLCTSACVFGYLSSAGHGRRIGRVKSATSIALKLKTKYLLGEI